MMGVSVGLGVAAGAGSGVAARAGRNSDMASRYLGPNADPGRAMLSCGNPTERNSGQYEEGRRGAV